MIGSKITHANFSVDDLALAKTFYVDKLGFKLKYEIEGMMMILESGGGSMVGVYYKPDHKAWDSTVLGVEVDDVSEAVEELKSVGVNVEKLEGTDDRGIMSDPKMGDAAWFKDPAGNWVCIERFGDW